MELSRTRLDLFRAKEEVYASESPRAPSLVRCPEPSSSEERVTYFVKLLGSTDWPMPDDPWDRDPEMHGEVRFPAKPPPTNVTRGDEFIYYGVGGTKCIFGASRAEDKPTINHHHSNPEVARRWPYAVPIELRKSACVPRLSMAPLLESVAPGLQEQIGHGISHFEIGQPEFIRAIRLLERARQDALRRGFTGP